MQQDSISLLSRFREVLFLGSGLIPKPIDHVLDLPGRCMVVARFIYDGQQLFKRLPVSQLNGCDDEIRLVFETDILKDVFEIIHILLYVGLVLEYLPFNVGLLATKAASFSFGLVNFRSD